MQKAHLQYLTSRPFGDPSAVFRRTLCIQFIHINNNILQIQKKFVLLQNEKDTIMCTYSISVDDAVLERVKPALPDDKSVEAWMQSQIDILLLQLADSLSGKPKSEDNIDSYAQHIARIRRLLTTQSDPMTSKMGMPDIVLSLLGAGTPVADNDLNARAAYNTYLEEKYQ